MRLLEPAAARFAFRIKHARSGPVPDHPFRANGREKQESSEYRGTDARNRPGRAVRRRRRRGRRKRETYLPPNVSTSCITPTVGTTQLVVTEVRRHSLDGANHGQIDQK